MSLHRCLLRWGIGSSGAESLAAARLTTSLEHSTLNAPMSLLTPSVHPVLRFFLHLISRGAQACATAKPSELPTTIGCTDATGIGSSGATGFSRTRPIQRFFEFFLRVLLCMAFLLHPWDLEMFTQQNISPIDYVVIRLLKSLEMV